MSDNNLDVRVIEHKLRRGELSQGEVDTLLEELPDEADEAEEIDVQFSAQYWERNYGPNAETDEDEDE